MSRSLPGGEIAADPRPRLRGCAALGVGGDSYDFIPLSKSQLGIAIGDVSARRIPAALLMASLRAYLRAAQTIHHQADLTEVMRNLNAGLREFDREPLRHVLLRRARRAIADADVRERGSQSADGVPDDCGPWGRRPRTIRTFSRVCDWVRIFGSRRREARQKRRPEAVVVLLAPRHREDVGFGGRTCAFRSTSRFASVRNCSLTRIVPSSSSTKSIAKAFQSKSFP